MSESFIGKGRTMSHKPTLELLRKLAELRSESYEINWEEWEQYEDMMDIEASVEHGIEDYEKKFYAIADEMRVSMISSSSDTFSSSCSSP